MFEFTRPIIERAEDAAVNGANACLAELRNLPLDDFGELVISLPNPELPRISAVLPAMASDEVQRHWTGNCGVDLLKQTNNFVRIVTQYYALLMARPLGEARILDFGCGYGRILRSMYYFADPDNLYGCDPWDKSISLCKEAGILGHLAISDYLPRTLPFEAKFDLIYAFSVFTHLSERATSTCLEALADRLTSDGLLVITIRPVEYWAARSDVSPDIVKELADVHRNSGFAFLPHNRLPLDGDITYGDTSISLDYIEKRFPQFKIEKIERTIDDRFQIIVFLRPVRA